MTLRLTPRVKEILSWYRADNPGVIGNLARLLNTGTLAGTGKLVILPIDQGFEHGPARTYGPNPPAYDPTYHFELALESGCNAYAAPAAQIATVVDDFAGQMTTLEKARILNEADGEVSEEDIERAIAEINAALKRYQS